MFRTQVVVSMPIRSAAVFRSFAMLPGPQLQAAKAKSARSMYFVPAWTLGSAIGISPTNGGASPGRYGSRV